MRDLLIPYAELETSSGHARRYMSKNSTIRLNQFTLYVTVDPVGIAMALS